MNKVKFICFLLMVTMGANAQTGLDPARLKVIAQQIELEIPAEEQRWLLDRATMDNYELEFCRDTFRIERMRCILINDLFEDLDKEMADSTQNKSEDGEAILQESKLEKFIAIYTEVAKRYDQMITRYGGMAEAKYPANLQKKWQETQKAWEAYRQGVLALFDATYQNTTMLKSLRQVDMNKTRLLEVYDFYQEVTDN